MAKDRYLVMSEAGSPLTPVESEDSEVDKNDCVCVCVCV